MRIVEGMQIKIPLETTLPKNQGFAYQVLVSQFNLRSLTMDYRSYAAAAVANASPTSLMNGDFLVFFEQERRNVDVNR